MTETRGRRWRCLTPWQRPDSGALEPYRPHRHHLISSGETSIERNTEQEKEMYVFVPLMAVDNTCVCYPKCLMANMVHLELAFVGVEASCEIQCVDSEEGSRGGGVASVLGSCTCL